jgi:hypothetical protein
MQHLDNIVDLDGKVEHNITIRPRFARRSTGRTITNSTTREPHVKPLRNAKNRTYPRDLDTVTPNEHRGPPDSSNSGDNDSSDDGDGSQKDVRFKNGPSHCDNIEPTDRDGSSKLDDSRGGME